MSNQKLTVVARILAKEAHRELVKSEVLKLIEKTRAEKGCLNYDLHQDNENPNLFLFYENWESKADWLMHNVNEHLVQFESAIDGAIEELVVNQMTHIA